MNGVRLMFCHWLQRLKINCFTRCTVHVLFSNTHSTHVIVIGCEILLLCTLIVKRLLLARCFSGQNFIIIGKTENKSFEGYLWRHPSSYWQRIYSPRRACRDITLKLTEYGNNISQPKNSLSVCYRVFIVRLQKPETDNSYPKCYKQRFHSWDFSLDFSSFCQLFYLVHHQS